VDLFRRGLNPWGREVLLGIAWDLMWAALVVGALFVVVHAVLAARARRRSGNPATPAGNGARLVRHSAGARFFHWTMALAMVALLITAFVPVMGFRFDWVTIHWIAGLALIATVVYHVVHVFVWQQWRNIWAGRQDVREGVEEAWLFLGRSAAAPPKPGKYPVAQKLFHHVATLTALAAIVTGLLMMVRIDTPLFPQSQYLLSDGSWGLVYVLHGLAGVGLIGLIIAHVYFAVRPEKRWLTRSMIKGWITRAEYLAHHDPSRWAAEPSPGGEGAAEAEAAMGGRA
jgi:formate dehydrogenase gamma subunit